MVNLEFQYVAVLEVLLLMVLTVIQFPRDKYIFSCKSTTIITLVSVQSYSAFMIWWFQMYRMIFVFCIYLVAICFIPYLAKVVGERSFISRYYYAFVIHNHIILIYRRVNIDGMYPLKSFFGMSVTS